MTLDLAAPLRAAIAGDDSIALGLSSFAGEPAIFTRRPVPQGADYPYVIINPTSAVDDQSWLTTELPIVLRDIGIYGRRDQAGTEYRAVEDTAYAIRRLFHRRKWAITVPGYQVIRIAARGPIPGPTDDQQIIGRVVGLTIELRRQ